MKPESVADTSAARATTPADGAAAPGQALNGGKLPERRPDSIWGGPGAGAGCTICGAYVSEDQMELEIEFAREDGLGVDRHHVHVSCFAAWEAELRKTEAAGSSPALPRTWDKRQNNGRDDLPFRRRRP